MPDRIVELTDELVAEVAAKFGVSEDEVRRQYAQVQETGPEAVLAEMAAEIADLENMVNEVADDVAGRWLNADMTRPRRITAFYEEGWSALTPEDIEQVSKGDLFLRMSVAIYLLAEARAQIIELMDGSRRQGTN